MAISVSKKKASKPSKKSVAREEHQCLLSSIFFHIIHRLPAAILFLFLIFIWSSSTTIISGKLVHVCLSSRKLNNRFCLSAGTHKSFPIPVQEITPNPTTNDNKNSRLMNVMDQRDQRDDIEIEIAVKDVEEQMKLQRQWRSSLNNVRCDGRGIYVYDLPAKFNKDLISQCSEIVPWLDLCKYFSNEGLGEPIEKLGKGWYQTHQYLLEPIFHSKVLKHPCRVHNQNEAKLFYVPFYGGLDILRWNFRNVSNDVKDTLPLELMKWLQSQPPWKRNSGKDHAFVLGKISWDFRRYHNTSWGTRLLELDEMQNPVKLLIERQPWHLNDIGIPHPTYFHPHSDEDIIAWQMKIISSTRRSLACFAGAPRPAQPDNIRSVLIDQCRWKDWQCKLLDCNSGTCDQPEIVMKLFMESEFCLQPPGDSPTRKSVFDSLVAGCIPVIFNPFTAYYQYPWHLPEDYGKYSVFIPQEEVRNGSDVMERLMKISDKEKDEMRRFIVYELFPGLVYGDSNSELKRFQDAFSITMNSLLERVSSI